MKSPVYIGIVTALYVIAFGTLFTLDGGLETNPVRTIAITAFGSLGVATLCTWRGLQISPDHLPRYLLPSIINGVIIAALIGSMIWSLAAS